MVSIWTVAFISLLSSLTQACVPSPSTGLYVDSASTAPGPVYGCADVPYPTLNQSLSSVLPAIGGIIILTPATTAYTFSYQTFSSPVTIVGNQQTVEIQGLVDITAVGIVTLKNLTLQFKANVGNAPITLDGTFNLNHVNVTGSSIGWGVMTGNMSFTSCNIQNTQKELMTSSIFGVELTIADSYFFGIGGVSAALLMLKPITSSPIATVFTFTNSVFLSGTAPTISILIDTSLFGDTYAGSANNAITIQNCTWKSFTSAGLSISTWFITAVFDSCTFAYNSQGISVDGETAEMDVTNSHFFNNIGRAMSFPLLGNPTVNTGKVLLRVKDCTFNNNGQGIAIDAGQLGAYMVIDNTVFLENGTPGVNGGCLQSTSVSLNLTSLLFNHCSGAIGPSLYISTTSTFYFGNLIVSNSHGSDGAGAYINNGGGVMSNVLYENLTSDANIIYTLSGVGTLYQDVTIRNCIAGTQVMNGYLNIWSIQNLHMLNSRAADMLLYYTGTTETLNVQNSIFYNSSASSVHLHPGGTIVNFINCVFNFTDDSSTVILINTGELTSLQHCVLSGTFRTIFSGLLAEYQFSMTDCVVIDAIIDGMFDGNYFTAYVNNTLFQNVTIRQASLVFLFKVSFSMQNVTFNRLSGNILNLSKSTLYIDNVTITNYTTVDTYQLLEASETNITISNFAIATFAGLGPVENAMFSFDENCIVNMTNCTFNDMSQVQNVGLNSVIETNMTLINVTFDNWNVTLFDAQLSGFWFYNCSFTRGGSGSPMSHTVGYDGGLIGGLHIANVWMENCTIANIGARNGGILYMYYEIPTKPTLQNFNSLGTFVVSLNTTFTNSTATGDGGMFYISEGSATLYNSTFTNSTAGNNGGFFNLLCNPQITDYYCLYNFTEISLNHSRAGSDGGAIKYERMAPLLNDYVAIDNDAIYGPFLAAYPIRSAYVNMSTSPPQEMVVPNITEASGQEIQHNVNLGLFDHLNLLVSTDSSSTMAVSSNNSAVLLSGLVSMQAVNGTYHVEHITVISAPGTSPLLYFASSAIDYVDPDPNYRSLSLYSRKTPLVYILRNCVMGEILKGEQCYVCDKGSYSFSVADTLCQKCKTGMNCLGGANVTIQADYWRPDDLSDNVFPCILLDKCLPGVGYECVAGYSGRLCTVCSPGFFRYGRALCSQCGSKAVSITQGVLIILGVACFLAFIIYSSLNAVGKKKKSDLSVQLRILINFVQVMMLMNNFQIVWPSVLTTYFDGLYVSGNSSQMAFSPECYSEEGPIKYMYEKLILMTVMPVAITGISVFCWGIVSVLKRKWMYVTQHNICTMCVLLLTVHPMILQTAGQMLTCKDMENSTSWLVVDMTIQCWVGEHLMYTTMMAVPVLVFWCIGIPLAFYVSLVGNRKRLGEEPVARRFAFIYSGYQRESYYWEFVVVVRKSYFVLVSNLLSTYNVDVQSYTGLLGLAFFLLIHNIKKPFASVKLNQLEAFSLIASIVTLICGMMYDTDLGTNEVTYYIMVAVVLLINGNFLYRCLSGVLGRLREVIVAKYPKTRTCLYFNRKAVYSVTHNGDIGESRGLSYPEIKD